MKTKNKILLSAAAIGVYILCKGKKQTGPSIAPAQTPAQPPITPDQDWEPFGGVMVDATATSAPTGYGVAG